MLVRRTKAATTRRSAYDDETTKHTEIHLFSLLDFNIIIIPPRINNVIVNPGRLFLQFQ